MDGLDKGRTSLDALCLGHGVEPLDSSPLISSRNLVPGLSTSVVKLDRLGQGATSNVFRAVHAATMRMLALKEISVSSDADRRIVRSEVRALRTQCSPLMDDSFTSEATSCPRIVDYYGSVVRDNGDACIAVEYVAGGSLQSWTDNERQCPEPWIAHLAYQALEALVFLHSMGRVHRDVKPGNLLITQSGDLKLADFGVAGEENCKRMVGTRRFMAPERLKGQPTTGQSDLWSLGLTLATAAMGESPISHACNEFEQLCLAEHAQNTIIASPSLSQPLASLIKQCLCPDPQLRPTPAELMRHPFLGLRFGWEERCPQVLRAIRSRSRLQGARSTPCVQAVVESVARARREDNVHREPLDAAMCIDLARELGLEPQSLADMLEHWQVHGSAACRVDYSPGPGGGGGGGGGGGDMGSASSSGSGSSRVGSGSAVATMKGLVMMAGPCKSPFPMGRTAPVSSASNVGSVAPAFECQEALPYAEVCGVLGGVKLGGVVAPGGGCGPEMGAGAPGGGSGCNGTPALFDTPVPSQAAVRSGMMSNLFHVADRLKAEVPVQNRLCRLRVYPQCFTGARAVRWMLDEGLARSAAEAVYMGNEMMKAGIFQHIRNEHLFEDSGVFYQVTDGKAAPEAGRGGKVVAHIARAIGHGVMWAFSSSGNHAQVSGRRGGSVSGISGESSSVGIAGSHQDLKGCKGVQGSLAWQGVVSGEEGQGSLGERRVLPPPRVIGGQRKRGFAGGTRIKMGQVGQHVSSTTSSATVLDTP
ncbi:unnamed protein product [Discosporangium mesarthrocarpum]